MKLSINALFLLAATVSVEGFTSHVVKPAFEVSSLSSGRSLSAPTALFGEASEQEEGIPKKSRFGGNQRAPTVQEISIMDDMITKLMEAKPYELPNAVSKAIRVISSPRFFIRIAERSDMTNDPIEKEKLSTLANNIVTTMDAVVSTAQEKLDDRAKNVEEVVKAAAEPDSGEFLVPLSADRIAAMKARLEKINPADLDEGFLTTIDTWMNKAHEDGLDGMVGILQKVLQMYAGGAIKRARLELQASVGAAVTGEGQAKANEMVAKQEASDPKPEATFMDKLLGMDTDIWDKEIRSIFSNGNSGVTVSSLTGEIQRTMEAVILGLENGSMVQRVQAEYLKELLTRVESVKV